MGAKIGVTKEEIDIANECLQEFEASLDEKCLGKIRLLGLLLAIPNPEGTYGVLAVKSNRVNDDDFIRMVKDMGTWMGKMSTQ
jgi:hypothetical protein